MTLVNLSTGDSQTRNLSFNPIARGRTEKIDFVTLGVSVEINADFPKSTRDIASNVQITQGKSQLGMNAKAGDAAASLRQLTLADRDAAAVGSSLKSYTWLDTLKVSGLRARALGDFDDMPAPFQEIRFSTSFNNSLSAALYDDSNGSGGADSFNVDPLTYQLGRDDLAVAGDRACVTAGTATQLKAVAGTDFSAFTAVTLTIGAATGQTLSLASAATSTDDFVGKFNAAVAAAGGSFTGLAAAKVSATEVHITDAKGRTLDWTGQTGAAAPTDTTLSPAVAQLEATTNQANFAALTSVTFTIGTTAGQTLSLSSAATDTDDFVSKFNAAVAATGGIFAGLTATKSSNTKAVIADSKGRSLTWTAQAGGAHTITPATVGAVTTRKTLDTALPRRLETVTGFSMTLAGQGFTGNLSVTSADTAATLAAKLETALQGLATAGNVDPANLTVENRGGILVVSDSRGRTVSALSLTGSKAQMYTRIEIRDTNGQYRSQGPTSATDGAHKSLAAGDTVVVTVHNGQTGAAAQEYVELSFRIENTDGLGELGLASGGAATPVAMLFLNSHKMFASAGQELDGTNFSFQVGHAPQAQDVLSFTLPAMSARGLGLTHTHTATRDAARNAIGRIDPAINRVSEIRAQIGALQNRFEFTIQNLGTMKENTESGRSALMDLDVASEMTRHVTQQVLVQAGVAMLAQANNVPSQLLKLFQ
jgi:flagellin-like hook-associated protein FlgL